MPCDDLQVLGALIGDASLVALGEAQHGAAEPLLFRNRLFEYLVRDRGFTAIALESGIVEGRAIYEYVRGGEDDEDTAVTRGLSWGFDRLPQNRALVRWLRQYNDEQRGARKVNFYGFDIPGSPGNGTVARGVDTGLLEAIRYLAIFDPTAAAALRQRVDPLLPNLRFDCCLSGQAADYSLLSEAARDRLTGAIADLIALLEWQASIYPARSAGDEFQWALRAALGARQADAWLRQIPVRWRPASTASSSGARPPAFLSRANDIRDRAQADNLEWVLDREGADGKVLVCAHRYHVSAAPVRVQWAPEHLHYVMGTYLRRRHRERLLVIGGLVGGGAVDCDGVVRRLEASPEALDCIARDLKMSCLLLDLRGVPAATAEWLSREQVVGHRDDLLFLRVREAFDVLLYIDTVTPAQ